MKSVGEKLTNYQQNKEFSRRCKCKHMHTHKGRMSGNSIQNVEYFQNNRIHYFLSIYYWKKSPVVLSERSFFLKDECEECQYHSMNLNNTKL